MTKHSWSCPWNNHILEGHHGFFPTLARTIGNQYTESGRHTKVCMYREGYEIQYHNMIPPSRVWQLDCRLWAQNYLLIKIGGQKQDFWLSYKLFGASSLTSLTNLGAHSKSRGPWKSWTLTTVDSHLSVETRRHGTQTTLTLSVLRLFKS